MTDPLSNAEQQAGAFVGCSGARGRLLDDGRMHFQHGPIDLLIGAWGEPAAIERAANAAWRRFDGLLGELVAELAALRAPLPADLSPMFDSSIAQRMVRACMPFTSTFITPMAAVAGAVADEVLAAMLASASLQRAYVNNGGDIAIHLQPAEQLQLGVVTDPTRPGIAAQVQLHAALPIRGIATSGWRGRSFSLGIADAVTVFAHDAACADAAATMIANAVDIDHPAVERRAANTLKDDTDLGARAVTVAVGPLDASSIELALERGWHLAARLLHRGLIVGAGLFLQQHVRTVGTAPLSLTTTARSSGL